MQCVRVQVQPKSYANDVRRVTALLVKKAILADSNRASIPRYKSLDVSAEMGVIGVEDVFDIVGLFEINSELYPPLNKQYPAL